LDLVLSARSSHRTILDPSALTFPPNAEQHRGARIRNLAKRLSGIPLFGYFTLILTNNSIPDKGISRSAPHICQSVGNLPKLIVIDRNCRASDRNPATYLTSRRLFRFFHGASSTTVNLKVGENWITQTTCWFAPGPSVSMRIRFVDFGRTDTTLDIEEGQNLLEVRTMLVSMYGDALGRCPFYFQSRELANGRIFTPSQFPDGSVIAIHNHSEFREKSFPKVDHAIQFPPARYDAFAVALGPPKTDPVRTADTIQREILSLQAAMREWGTPELAALGHQLHIGSPIRERRPS
jgi:hypothetical protein